MDLIFMMSYLDKSNMQRSGAMESRMTDWTVMYRDDVGRPLNSTLRLQMNTVPLPRALVNHVSGLHD